MAMIKCPECGKDISDKATACIHCGCPLRENGNKCKEIANKVIDFSSRDIKTIIKSKNKDTVEAVDNTVDTAEGTDTAEDKTNKQKPIYKKPLFFIFIAVLIIAVIFRFVTTNNDDGKSTSSDVKEKFRTEACDNAMTLCFIKYDIAAAIPNIYTVENVGNKYTGKGYVVLYDKYGDKYEAKLTVEYTYDESSDSFTEDYFNIGTPYKK